MKSFKTFLEDFNVFPRARYADSGKDINFRGATPAGFKGSNGISFPGEQENLILRFKKRRVKFKKRPIK
jgi:hypothetical protein|tara:strand:+ start:1592 stop:1798 length:207 start_codon:yes stop_codon:yes gene_type:complete